MASTEPPRTFDPALLAAVGAVVFTFAVAALVSSPLGSGPGRWITAGAVQVIGLVLVAMVARPVRRGLAGDPEGAGHLATTDRAGAGSAQPALLARADAARGELPPLAEAPVAKTADGGAGAGRLAMAGPNLDAALARLRFDERLESALDAVRDEEELRGVIARAVEGIEPSAPTELLLLTSRRSGGGVVQAAEAGPEGEGPGCPVDRAEDCEAMRTGVTRLYESSVAFDACPQLRGRLGNPCSAVCVPLRVLGQPIGVLHRTGPGDQVPPPAVVATLESLASKSGTRISLLRSRSDASRQVIDPATGTLDRASIEAQTLELARTLTPFAIAQGDIDHFGDYTESFGQDVANHALRLVGRTLQEILRPGDLIGRFGDDEFLVVLPGASGGEAQRALERAREQLALNLTFSHLPPLSVSFGVVESAYGQSLQELLVAADVAVSLAKDLGRNRVVATAEQVIDPLASEDGAY